MAERCLLRTNPIIFMGRPVTVYIGNPMTLPVAGLDAMNMCMDEFIFLPENDIKNVMTNETPTSQYHLSMQPLGGVPLQSMASGYQQRGALPSRATYAVDNQMNSLNDFSQMNERAASDVQPSSQRINATTDPYTLGNPIEQSPFSRNPSAMSNPTLTGYPANTAYTSDARYSSAAFPNPQTYMNVER